MKIIFKLLAISICMLLLSLQNVAFSAPVKKIDAQNLQKAYALLFPEQPKNQAARVKKAHQKRVVQKEIPARYRATQVAKKQIRTKYRWGGKNPKTGFDCSGLIHYAYKSVKVNIPRTARAQFKHTKRVSLEKLQAGDLIFFHTRRTRAKVNHVGIYLGGGKFIHAPRKGKRVSVAILNKYWRRKAVGAGRV